MPRYLESDLDPKDSNELRMQFGGHEDQMALAADMGYVSSGFMPEEQPYAIRAPATMHPWSRGLLSDEHSDSRYGYDGNDSEGDAMPPPYSEHDPKPPKSLPQMQTARRGTQKQAVKRGSYAYLGGGPALSTYRPNMAQGPVPPTPRVSTPQSQASRSGRAPTPKPTPSKSPTPRRQPSPTKHSSALSNPIPTSDKKPAARKKCSQCHVSGHDARNCPLNRFGLGKSSAGASQNLSQPRGFRDMSETTTTTTTMTTKHENSSSVVGGRISKGKAAPKKKGMGKK